MFCFSYKNIIKKLLLFCALVIYTTTNAQEVSVINNKGTKITVNNNKVTTAATAPIDPVEADIWFNTTNPNHVLANIWDGTAWVIDEHKGTQGSIFFTGVDGFPTENNGQFFWDNSNNRLGIGIAAPDESLHVANNMRLNGAFEDKDGDKGTLGQVLSSTATGTDWITTSNLAWFQGGNTLASSSFLGTTNDVAMEIRSNNTAILQFGRRQTLGLTQAIIDYDDDDQYITQLLGSNGVSALQFQADAASFYKPMFFTTSDGNFRLKGSAAGTDFFEMGSAGVSNDGEFEFIIGDDGLEPFIFKRFDFRDQLKKELFRIQGSSDAQDALPRIGINTGQLANSTIEINGSVATAINSTTVNLTLDETHHTVIVNANNTITLPAANTCSGRSYIIKNTTNTAITISSYLNNAAINTGTIDPYSTLNVQSDGSSWHSVFPRRAKFFQNFQGRASFTNNTWSTTNNLYGTGHRNWNAAKGTGTNPSYNTNDQAGMTITSDVTLNKFVMKNDFNANPTGTQFINLSVLRGNTYISIGTYTITGVSTTISIFNQNVNFQLLENDMLVWACRTVGGANRTSYVSLTFEFVY